MDEAVEVALIAISDGVPNNSLCWAKKLPDDALELLYAVETLQRDGKHVSKTIAADKFNELYDTGRPVTAGMVENHLNRKKGCSCSRGRDYL